MTRWAYKLNRELRTDTDASIANTVQMLRDNLETAENFHTVDMREDAIGEAWNSYRCSRLYDDVVSARETEAHIQADARCAVLNIAANAEVMHVAMLEAMHTTLTFLAVGISFGIGVQVGSFMRDCGLRAFGL